MQQLPQFPGGAAFGNEVPDPVVCQCHVRRDPGEQAVDLTAPVIEYVCYRPRYLNIQRLNYLWTIRHSPARIAGA